MIAISLQSKELAQLLPHIRYKIDDALSAEKFQPITPTDLPNHARIAIISCKNTRAFAIVVHSYLNLPLKVEEVKDLVNNFLPETEEVNPTKLLKLFEHLSKAEYKRIKENIQHQIATEENIYLTDEIYQVL